MSEAEVYQELTNAQDGARYSVYISWKNSSYSHVFTAEKEGGVVRYIDPQTGETDVSHYLGMAKRSSLGLLRMDNAILTADERIIKAIAEVKP